MHLNFQYLDSQPTTLYCMYLVGFFSRVTDAVFDGKLELTPTQETSLLRSFQLYDKNRDGVLDFAEIQLVCENAHVLESMALIFTFSFYEFSL